MRGSAQEACKAEASGRPKPHVWYANFFARCSMFTWCGFLHRDVKPANCLVKAWAGAVAFWEVRLSDFGCSCVFSSAATVPPPGTLAFWVSRARRWRSTCCISRHLGRGLQQGGPCHRKPCLPPLQPFIAWSTLKWANGLGATRLGHCFWHQWRRP